MAHLHLKLLGGFEVILAGQPITTFGTDKVRALLAYLAVESGRPHRRDELATMFWPESPARKAAHNLSQTLLRLRRALRAEDTPPLSGRQPFLLVNNQDVQFNPLSDYRLDVADFVELIRAFRQHQHVNGESCRVCIGWLQQAANLYRGDLLAGFSLRDDVPFEEWQVMQQEVLHRQAVEVLTLLMTHYERRDEPEQVQEYARRLVALEPWQEQAQLKLMAALAQCGRGAAALEQYAAYSRTLAQEFGMAPSPEARALYDQIRARQSNGEGGEMAGRRGRQGAIAGQREIAAGVAAQQGERRPVTALVCARRDPARRGDPEELYEQLTRCDQNCAPVLERYGGCRQPRQGTECLVYFGYPTAYEDAARRAMHAGLALIKAAEDADHIHTVGIHTGVMVSVAGELVGDAPDLARGCQRLAEPNSVVVTADTERLLRGWFDCQVIGLRALPGSNDEALIYRVVGESAARNRLEWLAQTHRLTRFIGREPEMKQLAACLDRVRAGQGQVIAVCGEPGIGKSRLLWELMHARARSVVWIESRCSPYFQNTNLYPLIHLLEQLLGFQPGDAPEEKRDKLSRTLARLGLAQPAPAWLLALLLGLPTDTPAPQTITEGQRERMREAFVALLGRCATEQPLALVIEDLHWADPSTVAWLGASIDALAAARCLTLLTYRPTFTPPWRPRRQLLQLTLGPLDAGQVELMVADLTSDADLPAEVRRRVAAQTDGIPLFVEELTRALAEADAQALGGGIPVTLRDSLLARLDRVGGARETAGWAAALGREFAYPVLAAVVPYAEARLQADLATLVEARMVNPPGDATPALYAFRHTLIQEAVHAALLRRTRQKYHQRIAETYTARFPQLAKTQPELLAEHYSQAGLPAQAADHWLRAGERAARQGAALEAQTCFDRVLALIEPHDRDRRWQALWGRETALYWRGERAAQQADIAALLALAESCDDDTRRGQAQTRRARYANSQADYREQAEAARAALAAARRAGNVTVELEALTYEITALMRLGERTTLPEVVAQTLAQTQGAGDHDMRSYALAAVALYHLEGGDLAVAAQTLAQSLDAARHAQNRNPDQESQYHGHLGFAYAQLGLYAQARATLEAGLELAKLTGIGRQQAYQMLNLGLVYWRSGDLNTAIQMEAAALKEYSTSGEAYGQAACRAYLGYIYEELGDWAAAVQCLVDARRGFAELDVDPDRFEAQATEARVLLAQGRLEEARQLTAEVWNYLRTQGTEGLGSPSWVYACIADVLDAIAIPGIAARTVIETGYGELMARADRISDLAWRRSFLQDVAENRVVVERWQMFHTSGRSNQSASLVFDLHGMIKT